MSFHSDHLLLLQIPRFIIRDSRCSEFFLFVKIQFTHNFWAVWILQEISKLLEVTGQLQSRPRMIQNLPELTSGEFFSTLSLQNSIPTKSRTQRNRVRVSSDGLGVSPFRLGDRRVLGTCAAGLRRETRPSLGFASGGAVQQGSSLGKAGSRAAAKREPTSKPWQSA